MIESSGMPVLVVVGVGGMGRAIARRLGSGKRVLLADFNEAGLNAVAAELRGDGFSVETRAVDVSDAASVRALAATAAEMGPIMQLAHTAGLSPVQASAPAIIAVDLVGVAMTLDAFGEVIAPGGAGVVIASMAGQLAQITPEQDRALEETPTDRLGSLPFLSGITPTDAYSFAKRANQTRMHAASVTWGHRGARVNTVSPGIISTPMGQQELAGPAGDGMRAMIEGSGTGRIGTPDDIAAAVAFLLGPDATFITGTDLLVDGGTVASMRA
ncbi:SDR family oxidoreductase [Microbacterium sp. Clip185]|uniref:SDR family oxidoreductase n=1 Tax=Microbacterium sp. Clip185 TaxID=3025663 RepID=UPI0023672557|nr:SDR family oxidoreductase [Microbacterium sp. Clip185]WDG18828.1 SDR family oxidoreductase [Microbacterium sp. Clip185]